MILATKYIEDHSGHAVHIYRVVSPIYTPRELNEMERSFLNILKVKEIYVYKMESTELTLYIV